jgi:geranylgeranyl diphosphate synthase type II
MFENYTKLIDNELNAVLKDNNTEYSELLSAMNYSVSAGGKRIRPQIMLEFARVCSGDEFCAVKFATALEMIHTYSLIHDDLPCMDNDDMRRGKPSCHIKFGEATALLAGDALLTDAFSVAASTENMSADRILKAIKVLSSCAGSSGMIGGQVIDLKYENSVAPLKAVTDMYKMKTGALLVAAAKIGCILGGGTEQMIENAGKFAENLGLAFQIKDDILDITSTAFELGKPIGSDCDSQKSTYVSHVGLEKAQEDVEKITNEAISLLSIFGNNTDNLKQLALSLCNRKN